MDRFGKVLLPFEKEFKNVFARASACLSDSSLCDSTNLKIFFYKKKSNFSSSLSINQKFCILIKSKHNVNNKDKKKPFKFWILT